jgi:hypothetical protein
LVATVRIGLKAIIAAVTVTAATLFAAPAHADIYDQAATALCEGLDANPTVQQVDRDVSILLKNGFTAKQAATFIVDAVSSYCPENMSVLRQYANASGGTQT